MSSPSRHPANVPAGSAPGGGDSAASARTTGIVSLAILCSRVLGLVRDLIFAALFPARLRDCFLMAFRTPNMLRDLFAEGALSTAFVTVFSKKLKTEGEAPAWALAHRILSLAVVFMSLISLGGVLLAPWLVRLLAPAWPEEKLDFTVTLAQIMYPFILLVSLAALVMGMLNARRIYGVPALASSFFNIGSIVGGWVLGWLLDPTMRHGGDPADPNFRRVAIIAFSVGTLLGGLAQLCVQLPSLKRTGYHFQFDSSALRLVRMVFAASALLTGLVTLPLAALGKWNAHLYPLLGTVALGALVFSIWHAATATTRSALVTGLAALGCVALGWLIGWHLDAAFGVRAMVAASIGTSLGGGILCRVVWNLGGDRPWKDEGVAKILKLMWPAVLAGSAVQVNVLLNSIFASFLEEKNGPVTWLNYAFRLMQLPLGVFGVAVATVTLPVLARVATDGITPKFREVLGGGNRLVVFLTLPCAVGLFLLAEPVISLLYERGQFHREETLATAAALRWYAVGLVFYACIKVIQPAFTAIDRRFVPMVVAMISIAVNAALNSFFVFYLRPAVNAHMYLALSTAVVAFTNCSILYVTLAKTAGGLDTEKLLTTLARLLVPSLVLGLICWGGMATFLSAEEWRHYGLFKRVAALGVVVGFSGLAYFVTANLFRIPEARQFADIVQRRLHRGRK
ncbi:MAG: murein biosynthesis integral membrane protein MurJ [Verrucomicrobiales bacterium]|nr:murein biosynthesis integral membrane protein MurJ [Verrucomicrobiales bacterium]